MSFDKNNNQHVILDGGSTTVGGVTSTTIGSKKYLDVNNVSGGSSGGGGGGGGTTYYAKPAGASGADAVSAYASATSITVTGLNFTFIASDIQSIRQIPNAGGEGAQDTQFTDVADFSVTGTTITVANAAFAATDTFLVTIASQIKGYDQASNLQRSGEVNPLNLQAIPESLVDTTNVVAAATYYPNATGGSMLGSNHLCLNWKHVDGDATTTTFSIQGTNDEDTTNADWVNTQFQVQGLASATVAIPTITGTVAGVTGQPVVPGTVCDLITSAVAQTVKALIDCDNFNYATYRVVLTPGDATNTEIIKLNRLYA